MFPLLNLNKLIMAGKTLCKHSKTKFRFFCHKKLRFNKLFINFEKTARIRCVIYIVKIPVIQILIQILLYHVFNLNYFHIEFQIYLAYFNKMTLLILRNFHKSLHKTFTDTTKSMKVKIKVNLLSLFWIVRGRVGLKQLKQSKVQGEDVQREITLIYEHLRTEKYKHFQSRHRFVIPSPPRRNPP